VSNRAQVLVSALLETDPDSADLSYLKKLPQPFDAAVNFVRDQMKRRMTGSLSDHEAHRQYALVLRSAIKQFGRPENYGDLFSEGIYIMADTHASASFIEGGEALELYGDLLVGVRVNTEAYGEYPGGPSTIIQISPDPEGAPEISFQVENPEYDEKEIGVFQHEGIQFL